MRIFCYRKSLLFIVLAFAVHSTLAADAGAVSGVVRDNEGMPLSGIRITLTATSEAKSKYQTTSATSGEYRFVSLAAGEYILSAQFEGYMSPVPQVVRITAKFITVYADLVLSRSSSASGSASNPSHTPLQFQTAGIRGLIDPGGYSASSNSAASGLLRGIADIRRTDRNFSISAARHWPCGLEPELLRAVAEHPGKAEANRRLGQFYAAHEQPAKAIPLLRRALEIDDDDLDAARALAVAWLQSGDFQNAQKLLTSIAKHRGDSEVHQLLARADEGLGMFLEAAQEYRSAGIAEASEESAFGLGYELVLAGSLSDGVAAFENGVRKFPRSIPLRIGVGTAQFLSGKTAEGLASLLAATDIDPTDPRPYSFLASASTASNDKDDRVRNCFKRLLELKPDSANANFYYALALSRDDSSVEKNRVEDLLKRAVTLDPNLAQAHLQLGAIYTQRDDYEDAVPEFETAVRLDQKLAQAHYRLAMAYKHIGRLPQSAREMEIFRLASKSPAAGTANQGIEISQFISVMDAPDQRTAQETACPNSTR